MTQISEHIKQYIYTHLPQVQTDYEFYQIIRYIYVISFNCKSHIRFNDFIKLKNASSEDLYTTFSIKKKSGKKRIIHAPNEPLKKVQQCLNIILQAYYKPNDNVCGFIPQRSIIYGAAKHANKNYVYNIDLTDFFDHVDVYMIKRALENSFNWSDQDYFLPLYFAKLCCCNKNVKTINNYGKEVYIVRNVLPQGAPTSPILTNIVCQKMDEQLADLAIRYDATYTRYADDITFSCNTNIFDINSAFNKDLRKIIERNNPFVINKKKTRLQICAYRQEVTGIVVNQKVNICTQYVKQLRMWLYLWEHYGIERAQQYFLSDYRKNNRYAPNKNAKIENVVDGKLEYLKMVVGADSEMYKKLFSRYIALVDSLGKRKKNKKTNKTEISKTEYSNIQITIHFPNFV